MPKTAPAQIPDIRIIAAVFNRLRKGKPVDRPEHYREIFNQLRACAVFTGGFPCQDLSVAGARAGLAGERSGLWYAYRRIIALFRPAWVVIENVPGLLSSNEGRDFAVILCGLADLGYGWSYRVLDAQYFGLAQRRERVFVVASLGTMRCAEVLFEPESLCGDSAPSREAGKGVAGTISARTEGGGGLGTDLECGGGLSKTLKAAGNCKHRADSETYIPTVSHCLNGGGMGRQDYETESFITHTLRGEGFDASEGGTGRGTPIVPDVMPTMRAGAKSNSPVHGARSGDLKDEYIVTVAPTLDARSGRAGENSFATSGGLAVGFNFDQSEKTRSMGEREEQSPSLRTVGGVAVAFTERTRKDGRNLETQDECAYALTNPGSGGRTHSRSISVETAVRRLTPTECERLQGFPDGWTVGQSDSARYRQIGNSVAVPCVQWIARRIAAVIDKESVEVRTIQNPSVSVDLNHESELPKTI